MVDFNTYPSSRTMLCILKDGDGKPMHMKIIGSNPEEYRALCRDYAAYSLLKQDKTALKSTIEKYQFKDKADIPDIQPENYEYMLKYIDYQERNDTGQIRYGISENLKGYIDEFFEKIPKNCLFDRFCVKEEDLYNNNVLEELSIENQGLVWEALKRGGFEKGKLVETPQGNWLFMYRFSLDAEKNFKNFLEQNFFNPQLDFDQIKYCTVWFHHSHTPIEINNFIPPKQPGPNLFPETKIDPNNYYIREQTFITDISPKPDVYMQLFTDPYDIGTPDKNFIIATLLFFEQNGYASSKCIETFLQSEFAKDHEAFSAELRKPASVRSAPESIIKLKAMAKQIIDESGFHIRGREQAPQQKKSEKIDQTNDFFYPRNSKSRHI